MARMMRQKCLVGRCRRPRTRTTISDPEAEAADLIERHFGAGTNSSDFNVENQLSATALSQRWRGREKLWTMPCAASRAVNSAEVY
jgi:hypothetical protein